MSNYYFPPMDQDHGQLADSQLRVQTWMLGQMAQYPPPPTEQQHHYPPLYPSSSGAQQLMDPQQQLQYSSLNNHSLYPKPEESATSEQTASTHQMQHLAQELQQHTTLGDQQHHHLAQTPQHAHHPPHCTPPPGQRPLPPLAHPSHAATESAQKNRLRKACDSCSIRKVKVCLTISYIRSAIAKPGSVTSLAHHAVRVHLSTYHARSTDRAAEEVLQIDTPKPSSGDA